MIEAARAAARALAERTERRIGAIRAAFERHRGRGRARWTHEGHDADAAARPHPAEAARLEAASPRSPHSSRKR